MPLRDLEIRALKPEARVYKRTDERGLYLEVHPNGSKLCASSSRILARQADCAGSVSGSWARRRPTETR